ncbi:hypothetical protein HP550_00910 [Cellulomonas humilata]|uniref:Uncharacterized protein n=1 Tax=Cellulomonas humilata TaxID=144055 RepID=A0A7Y5ZYX1_9CELL|nr:hypothetical protein [Cellulomonas humilata]NUU15810.1 hypothetical protein [Cellulomonas humilata]
MTANKSDPGEQAEPVRRTKACLLRMLESIDQEGWDGPTGTQLLQFVRVDLARPLAIDAGLRGLAASQGEASAWQAAWIAMTRPGLRDAKSPWGVIWRAAQRAALGEVLSARYGKDERRALEVWAAHADRRTLAPVSLDSLRTTGWDSTALLSPAESVDLDDVIASAGHALVDVGWSKQDAVRIVAAVTELPDAATDPRSGALGWRRMATTLGVPPWQARRLCVVLRGTTSWRGLFARIITEGPGASRSPAMLAALRSTRVRNHRSPVLAAERAVATQAHQQHAPR